MLKAKIFATGGQASKGFSIALRAASSAARLFLMPTLLEALTVLAAILNELFEFGAARDILKAALPMVCFSRHLFVTVSSVY